MLYQELVTETKYIFPIMLHFACFKWNVVIEFILD